MKLAGPHKHVRFVFGRDRTVAVVQGVFPPERATTERETMQVLADVMRPIVTRELRAFAKVELERVFGNPTNGP